MSAYVQVYFTVFGYQTNQLWIVKDAGVIALILYSEVRLPAFVIRI